MAVNRYEMGAEIALGPTVIKAGSETVPCAGKKEVYSLGLIPYQDHGRLAYYGSTIKASSAIAETAKSLNPDEAERLNEAVFTQLERLLEGKPLDSAAVLSSSIEGKPDISVVIIGNPWNESSLRLYCHPGKEVNGATILWVDGRTRKKGAERIEKALRQDGGYKAPKKWGSKKRS